MQHSMNCSAPSTCSMRATCRQSVGCFLTLLCGWFRYLLPAACLLFCILLRCTQAVEADAIDILAVQAPECKELPECITDLLSSTRSSILIYKIKAEPSAAAVAAAAGALGSASAALADAAAAAAAESLRQGVTFAV